MSGLLASECLVGWPIECLANRPSECLTDRPVECLADKSGLLKSS
jgi:hypothetical protein